MFSTLVASTPWPEQPGSRSALGPCPGTATAMAVAELANEQALLVVVVPSSASAAALERELPLFSAADLNILTLPDWETLPYDNFSPHQDIVSERLSTFHQLKEITTGVLIVPITTLMQRTPPVHYVAGNSLVLDVGQALDSKPLLRTSL